MATWAIDQDHPTGSDHEAIVLGWEDIEVPSEVDFDRAVTGWQIQALVIDSESLERAAQA